MADAANTQAIKKKIFEDQLSVSEYERIISPKMTPKIVPLGHFMTFNDNNLHGSIELEDELPRISFDFRIAFKPYEIGVKIPGIDYVQDIFEPVSRMNYSGAAKRARTIVFTNGRLSHLTHATQRLIISDFCKLQNLIPYRESSEFYGMKHFPQISEWASKDLLKPVKERKPIVLASLECFENPLEIIKICSKAEIKVYDALANCQLC
jgi:hypothetical protein